jgi:hypothetical protein
VTTRDLPRMWRLVGVAAAALIGVIGVVFAGAGRMSDEQ